MNCAWCSPSDNGTDGICGACMLLYFKVNPASIYAEIEAREAEQASTRSDRGSRPLAVGANLPQRRAMQGSEENALQNRCRQTRRGTS
jgi:hypothetical protein